MKKYYKQKPSALSTDWQQGNADGNQYLSSFKQRSLLCDVSVPQLDLQPTERRLICVGGTPT